MISSNSRRLIFEKISRESVIRSLRPMQSKSWRNDVKCIFKESIFLIHMKNICAKIPVFECLWDLARILHSSNNMSLKKQVKRKTTPWKLYWAWNQQEESWFPNWVARTKKLLRSTIKHSCWLCAFSKPITVKETEESYVSYNAYLKLFTHFSTRFRR